MKVKFYLTCIWFMLCMTDAVNAEDAYSIPKIAFSFDFNTPFSTDNAIGPRMQVSSNNNYFGNNKNSRRRLTESMAAYTFGLGFGDYRVNSLKKKEGSDNDLYFLYGVFTICYQNQGMFEPFAGVYPGLTWGVKSEFFVNPVAGINIAAFKVRRNWNSILFQTYGQVRIEYNTMLSTAFLGCGIILQIL